MRRAPAKHVRACILRKWCPVSHVAFEAPLRSSRFTLHTSHSTLHTSNSTLHTSLHFTHNTSHCTPDTAHFALHTALTLHTPHFTLRASHCTLSTSDFPLHTSHSALHTSHTTLHTPHFTLHNAVSHVQTHHLFSFPINSRDIAIRDPQNNFRLTATKPHACHAKCTVTLPNTSPILTFPMDSATTRLKKKQNDEQTVHHPQTPYQENKNPSLRIREKAQTKS